MAEETPSERAPDAEETEAPASADTPRPPAGDTPPSWGMIVGGLIGAGALAMAAASLGLLFMQSRTNNLLPHTEQLAAVIDETLQATLPPQNIFKSAPTLETAADGSARWYAYNFEVEVPAHLSADGIKTLLRDTMLNHRVGLVEAPGTAVQRNLMLSLGNHKFADVLLHQQLPDAPKAEDLRNDAYRVARDAEQTLIDSGVPPEQILRYEPVPQQDRTVLWATTRLDVELPGEMTANAVAAAIEARLIAWNVAVNLLDGDAGATLNVLYKGKVCAEIRCTRKTGDAATSMPDLSDILPGIVTPPGAGADAPPAPPLAPLGEADAMDAEQESEPPAPETTEATETEAEDESPRPADDGPAPTPPTRGMSLEPPKARQQPKPDQLRVAIILDDGGWGGETTSRVLALDPKLTLAILPYSDQDEDTAIAAAERGFEVMLHMPMETYAEGEKPYTREINTGMDREEIQRLARAAIAEVPGIAGINNHRGSKFTDDAERMGWFLEVAQEEAVYFVDSVTLHTSQAYRVAQSMGIPSARRDVFLDNEKDPDYIRGQFDELLDKVRQHGEAVGIGHFRDTTIDVLEEVLPRLKEEGIELVHASELVR